MRLVLILIALWSVAGVPDVAAADKRVVTAVGRSGELQLQTNPVQMNGTCSFAIAPVEAVVVGAVMVSELKPTEAKASLKRLLDEVQSFVKEHRGSLVLGQIVRAVHDPRNSSPESGARPFLMLQHIEVKLGLDADFDLILDGLMKRGVNRFGQQASATSWTSTPAVAVLYRSAALQPQIDEALARCARSAFDSWCKAGGQQHAACALPRETVYPRLQTGEFWFNSVDRVTTAEGHYQNLSLSKQNLAEQIEIGAEVAVQFQGNVNIYVPSSSLD